VTDLERKQAKEAQAEDNHIAQEDTCRAKALVVWERRRAMTRRTMKQDDLKVLIQDMERVLDLPLRNVSIKGDSSRPVIEAQCKEREVHLVKGKKSIGDELTHYNLHVLLEAEGVTTLESDLFKQAVVDLCLLGSTLFANVRN
jgi:hypothetical protein